MKLFTRLLDSGMFVFWKTDGDDTSVNLKISLTANGEKITLIDIIPKKGENFYSFDRIGSGDYEIELNGFKNGKLYQTESKAIKFVGTVQRSETNLEMIAQNLRAIIEEQKSFNLMAIHILDELKEFKEKRTDPYKIARITKETNKHLSYF